MIKRCIEVSTGPAKLSLRNGQLVLSRGGEEAASVPIEDLALLVLDTPAVTLTHALLADLLEHNVAVVSCRDDHLPVGMFLPLEGNNLQAQAFQRQVAASAQAKRRAWKAIVQAKIRAQALHVESSGAEAGAFRELVRRVKVGDPENLEAQAAQRYWPLLFGEGFRRRRNGEPPNNLLNYGYAILRAATARALVGAGLHPTLGIYHRNQYNAYALADDLMEPLRPLVDHAVRTLWQQGERELSSENRRVLLELSAAPVQWRGEQSPLMVALARYAANLRDFLTGDQDALDAPVSVLPEGPKP